MSHQDRDRDRVDAILQRRCGKPMTKRRRTESSHRRASLLQFLPQSTKSAIDGTAVPWVAVPVPQNRSRRIGPAETINDGHDRVGQVKDTRSPLPFGVLSRQNHSRLRELTMTGLDNPCLLRSCTRLKQKREVLAEGLIGDMLQYEVKLSGFDEGLSTLSNRPLDRADWAMVDPPFTDSPIEDTLETLDRIRLGRLSPIAVVQPLRHMQRLQAAKLQARADTPNEGGDEVTVPAIGEWGSILLTPSQIGIAQAGDRVRRPGWLIRHHQLVVSPQGFLLVGGEPHHLAPMVHIPSFVTLLEERFSHADAPFRPILGTGLGTSFVVSFLKSSRVCGTPLELFAIDCRNWPFEIARKVELSNGLP